MGAIEREWRAGWAFACAPRLSAARSQIIEYRRFELKAVERCHVSDFRFQTWLPNRSAHRAYGVKQLEPQEAPSRLLPAVQQTLAT